MASLVLWPLAAAQVPASSPMTLQQVLDIAKARNPLLLSAARHVDATRSSEVTAGLRVNPTFTVSGADVSLPANNPSSPYSYVGNVSRLFERGQKRRWRLDIARSTIGVAESQYNDQQRLTVLQVKNAFTNMLAAKGALDIAHENLESYHKTVELSRARLDAGDISKTDFERIDLQLAEFESDFDTAQLNLTQAGDALQLLMGLERPDPDFHIAGELDRRGIVSTLDTLEQQALTHRPDYLAAEQSVNLANANVKLADAGATADPTLGAEFERVGVYNSAGFQISIPLRVFDRNQGEKQRTRYEAQSFRMAETAARNQVISDVEQAWAAYESARRVAERYNSHYLAESERVRSNLEFSYRHGAATLLDYLDGLRDYRQIHLDALAANLQVWLSIHQLSYAAATEVAP
ncbi:TolC family protein [Acidobacteria bacterium AB60]|nr:TolC family protein [Acidobacteria bacterium AB60]